MNLNANGLKRVLKRSLMEYRILKSMPDGRPADWLKAPWNLHHYIDMYTESCRRAPYLMGRVWGIYYPLSIIAIGVLIGKVY